MTLLITEPMRSEIRFSCQIDSVVRKWQAQWRVESKLEAIFESFSRCYSRGTHSAILYHSQSNTMSTRCNLKLVSRKVVMTRFPETCTLCNKFFDKDEDYMHHQRICRKRKVNDDSATPAPKLSRVPPQTTPTLPASKQSPHKHFFLKCDQCKNRCRLNGNASRELVKLAKTWKPEETRKLCPNCQYKYFLKIKNK